MRLPANRDFSEPWIAGLMILVYALLSYLSLRWYPLFIDEPAYLDPAVNFSRGQGFSSGCWQFQGYGEFWAGNVPLYQFVLLLWLKCFGFGQVAARSLNIPLVAVGLAFFWAGIRRLGILRLPQTRLACLAGICCSHAAMLWINFGRPDSVCIPLAGLALFAFAVRSGVVRCGLLCLIAALAPWAALPFALVICLAGLAILTSYRKRFLPEVISLALGGLLGMVTLLWLYDSQGVLDKFLQSIAPHSRLFTHSGGPSTLPVNMLKQRIGGFSDYTLICLIAASVCVWLASWHESAARPWRITGLLALVGVPLMLALIGVFPIYYAWFAFVPALVALLAIWEMGFFQGNLLKACASCSLVAMVLLGYPRVWINGFLYRSDDAVGKMESFVASVLHPTDIVIAQHGWYTAKVIGSRVYFGMGAVNLSPAEWQGVNVIICEPGYFEALQKNLHGKWSLLPENLISPNRNTHRLPISRFYRDNPTIPILVYRRLPPR